MKAAFFLYLLPFLLVAQTAPPVGNSAELVAAGAHLFPVEKGYIHYAMDGQPNDTLVFVFNRYGWRQVTAEYGVKMYYGMKTPVNTREIYDGLMSYSINLKDKKGTYVNGHPVAKMASYKNTEELIAANMARMGAVASDRQATHLGYTCMVWSYTEKGVPLEIWTWQGLILKKQTAKGWINAIELNVSAPVDEKWFVVPSDIVWQN